MPRTKDTARSSRSSWLTVEENYHVPSWKTTQPENETGHIKDGALYALVEKGLKITQGVDGTTLPARSDSVYLHPDTMKLCGMTIATPTVLIGGDSGKEVISIVKPWPTRAIKLDRVGLSSALTHSLCDESVSGRSLVCLYPLATKSSSVSMATNVTLRYGGCGSIPKERSFPNYLLIKNDGQLVLEGSVLSVQYNGQEMFFTVHSLSSHSNVDLSLTEGDSLSTSLRHLTLATPPRGTPVGGANKENVSVTPGNLATPPNDSLDISKPLFSTPKLREYEKNNFSFTSLNGRGLEGVVIGKISASTTKIDFVDASKPVLPVIRPQLSSVGGLKDQIQLLLDLVSLPLSRPHIIKSSGVQFPKGLILHGPPGTGKTLLAEAIAGHTHCPSNVLSAFDLGDDHTPSLLENLLINIESLNEPRLIVINDIDNLFNNQEPRPQVKTVLKLFDLVNHPSCEYHVVVMATTNRIDSIGGGLRQPGRFDMEIEVPAPGRSQREDILQLLLRDIPNCISEEEVELIAASAHGYVGGDLKAVCREAQYIAFRKQLRDESCDWSGCGLIDLSDQRVLVCLDDLRRGMGVVKPSAMREISIEVPKVLWSDIGGLDCVKTKLKECIEWPLKYPESFKRLGVEPPGGVLLYGPPGCSKTMIARALATESGLNFLSVKGPELFSKWVGDSERAVRQVFSRARAVAPSIIFFDEIDALATHRQGDGSKVGDRVLAQLLTEMDGLVSLNNVTIIAATNRPDILDKALLRPGRIDRLIYVPLPTPPARREILQIRFTHTPIAEDVDVEELVSLTDLFSGAEVVALVQEAALLAMHEDVSLATVARRHFVEALLVVRPRTDMKTIEFYEKYNIGCVL